MTAATERSKVPVADWVATEPKVAEWAKRISMKSEETAKVYASSLRRYWGESLSKCYSTLEAYVAEVTEQSKAADETATKWAQGGSSFQWSTQSCAWLEDRKSKVDPPATTPSQPGGRSGPLG